MSSMRCLAEQLDKLGKHKEAVEIQEKTVALLSKVFGKYHSDTVASIGMLSAYYIADMRILDAWRTYREYKKRLKRMSQ